MSKQSEAKARQYYNPKPVLHECSNCAHFTSVITTEKGYFDIYIKETNLRCAIGGFAVKKRGTCIEHDFNNGVPR